MIKNNLSQVSFLEPFLEIELVQATRKVASYLYNIETNGIHDKSLKENHFWEGIHHEDQFNETLFPLTDGSSNQNHLKMISVLRSPTSLEDEVRNYEQELAFTWENEHL